MSEIVPQSDLPFPSEVIEYFAKRLRALEIDPDRDWLRKEVRFGAGELALFEHRLMAVKARESVPRSLAHWELSEFYGRVMPMAVLDLTYGKITRFEHFEFLYVRILGEAARPWLPSIYLAALSSPNVGDADDRIRLFRRFEEDRLRVEEEAEAREGLAAEDY